MSLIDNLTPAPADASPARPELKVPRVVVVVDRRLASEEALAWAADEAWCRGMPLRIVTAFADPASPHGLKTIEQAIRCQQRLRRGLQTSRPWLDEAECIVYRGSLHSLLVEATEPDDVLVVGEAAEVSAMNPAQRPGCPVVIVPVQRAMPTH
jgi:hypothetical protein